jgi:hypothetical protein
VAYRRFVDILYAKMINGFGLQICQNHGMLFRRPFFAINRAIAHGCAVFNIANDAAIGVPGNARACRSNISDLYIKNTVRRVGAVESDRFYDCSIA